MERFKHDISFGRVLTCMEHSMTLTAMTASSIVTTSLNMSLACAVKKRKGSTSQVRYLDYLFIHVLIYSPIVSELVGCAHVALM